MGNDVNVGNIIVGFGGVFLLGVIGFLVAWFSEPDEDAEPGGGHHARGRVGARSRRRPRQPG